MRLYRLPADWTKLAVMALLAMLPAPASAAPGLGLGDVFRLHTVADPQISPDGRYLAHIEQWTDIATDGRPAAAHLIDLRTGTRRPILSAGDGPSQPRWSEDGRLALVAADARGIALLVIDPATGTTSLRLPLPHYPAGLAWSADGKRLAYMARSPDTPAPGQDMARPAGAKWAEPAFVTETAGFQAMDRLLNPPTRSDIYVIEAAPDARPQRLSTEPIAFSGSLFRGGLAWTRDGSQIFYAVNPGRDFWRNLLVSAIFAIDTRTGAARKLSRDGESDYGPVASPDGKMIAWLCWDTLKLNYIRHDICLHDLASGTTRHLANRPDNRTSTLRWLADSRALLASFEDAGRQRIAQFDLDGGYKVRVDTGSAGLDAYSGAVDLSVARDGTLAFVTANAALPGDVATLSPAGTVRRLTSVNQALLAQRSLGRVEEFRYPAVDGKSQLHAVVTLPANYVAGRRYPLFVYLHGGRSLAFGPNFDTIAQVFANHGYVVVMPNYRLSGSLGSAYANEAPPYPTGAYDDIDGAIAVLAGRGLIDPDRLFIGGGSGGALISAWTIGKTDRFKAAALWFGTYDWASNNVEAASGFTSSTDGFGGQPWDDPLPFLKRSPISLVRNVKTPAMLVVGDRDRVTPLSQSMMYFNALQYLRVPSQLRVVPDEAHGVSGRPSNEMGLIRATLAWFARHGSGVPVQEPDLAASVP
jgi:dipeptidyl aminopeptidase/acylaminoacyl peptidase